MTQRNKSLLEAFKASGAIGSTPPAAAQAPVPPAAPPSAPAAPSASPVRVSLTDPRPARSIVLLRSQLQLLGAVAALAVVCAFLLGRASVRIAAAAGDGGAAPENPTGSEQQPATQPANSTQGATPPATSSPNVDRTAHTAAELALLDPKNVWTVKLVDYKNNDYEKRLALDTFAYVTQQGLPAAIVANAGHIYILVGAAPTQIALDSLVLQCKTMKGPPPKSKDGEFQTAYLDRIERLYPRNP